MKKAILYRLFGFGAIPKKLLQGLEREGVIVSDEGINGWFNAKRVNGPARRYRYRTERFSGCLVITKKRVLCYTYWKRQINIPVDHPKISELYFSIPKTNMLSVAFESSVFMDGWEGVIEFRFTTDKVQQFSDALKVIGAQQGAPADAMNARC